MSNNLGLYVRDDTEHLEKSGYPLSGNPPEENTWQRTGLYQNGKPITKTSVETNNMGLYFVADKDGYEIDPVTHTKHSVKGKLLLNGSNVANVDNGGKYGTHINSFGLSVGETQLSAPNSVINITLEDYNTLRGGTPVDGYARYNDEAVYNIVDDVEKANLDAKTNPITFIKPEGIYDVIYNSWNNTWEENTLSINTMLDINTPVLSIRHADIYGIEKQGICIEYFVDNKAKDSLVKGNLATVIKDDTIVPETFTVIVRDSYRRKIYSHTTYAGHHRITTDSFKDNNGAYITGKTWYSIQCIDNSGRGTCEWFFEVFIKPEDYTPRVYEMSAEDLTTYGITPDRDDPVLAYKNRLGFARLINDKKDDYDVIKFYNPNPNLEDLEDSESNLSYYINIYSDIGVDTVGEGDNAVVTKHSDIDRDLSNNAYLTRDEGDFNLAHQDYYIIYYNDYDGNFDNEHPTPKIDGITITPPGGTPKYKTLKDGADTVWSKLYGKPNDTGLEAFKIEPGKTFRIGDRDVIVPIDCVTHEDILDWIWKDGAGICRDKNNPNKIVRHGGGPSDYDTSKETRIDSNIEARRTKCLRVLTINGDSRTCIAAYKDPCNYEQEIAEAVHKPDGSIVEVDGVTFANYPFKARKGYYYVSYYHGIDWRSSNGTTAYRYGERNLPILNNITIDFNGTSWKLLDALLVDSATDILPLNMCTNVTIKNGWIKGVYDASEEQNPEEYIITLLKRGYLSTNIFTTAPWEGCGLVSTVASRFCKFDNMRISGPLGYNCRAHGFGAHTYIDFINNSEYSKKIYPSVTKAGYTHPINGTIIADDTCIIKKSNDSLLLTSSYDYVAGESTDICLVTTPNFMKLSDMYITGHDYLLDRSNINTLRCDDEINIGDWNRRPNMKYPELFIHFYDTNKQYLRTVKTQVNRRVKKFRDAAYIKLTVYLTGTLKNGSPKPYLSNAINTRLATLQIGPTGVSEGILYNNCKFHMSKSCMIEQTAINILMKNCAITNPVYAPQVIALENPYPVGSEEHAGLQMLFTIENSSIQHVPFTTDADTGSEDQEGGEEGEVNTEDVSNMRTKGHHQINFSRNGTFVNFKNCTGFTAKGNITGLYIADSYMYAVSNSISPRYMPDAYSDIKHSIIENVGSWDSTFKIHSKGRNWLTQSGGEKITAYSACEEPVNAYMPIDETFFNKPLVQRNNRTVKGHLYHGGEFPFDIYTSMTYERLLALWNARHNYSNPDNNEGWVHFICYSLSSHNKFGLGYKSLKDYLVKNGSKIVLYVDGKQTESIWSEVGYNAIYGVTIPEYGYHVVSYRLIPGVPTSNCIGSPEGALLAELPRYVTDNNISMGFADMFNKSKLVVCNSHHPICPIIYNADKGIGITGTYGGGTIIDVYLNSYNANVITWGIANIIVNNSFNLETLI